MTADRPESQSLLDECAEWVAMQLEEENVFVDPGLVSLVMEIERSLGSPRSANQATAIAVEHVLAERGVQAAPSSVDAALVFSVLQWEDEFMALAGRARPA